jgi:hypothetical protein
MLAIFKNSLSRKILRWQKINYNLNNKNTEKERKSFGLMREQR